MTVTATGLVTKPLAGLATLVASCAQFQADCGVATAADALAFVHWPEADDDDIETPRAIIRFGQEFSQNRLGPGTWDGGGTLELSFEYPLQDETTTAADQLAVFANTIGTILDQMQALEGQGDNGDGSSHVHITSIALAGGPEKCNPQQENGLNYFGVTYLIRWSG